MGTLKKEPLEHEKGPDVVGALRDWVGSDHRIASTTASEESAPDGTRSLASAESAYQDPAASAQDLSAVDARGSSARVHQDLYDFHIAPPIQGQFDPDPQQVNFQGAVSDAAVANRDAPDSPEERAPKAVPAPRREAPRAFSVIRRVAHTLAYGVASLAIVAVVVAFLSSDNLRLAGGSNQSVPQTLNAGSPTSELNPVPQQQLAPRSQLDAIANDVASIQRSVERLAARQAEMERSIAMLQAAEQNLRQVTTIGQAAAQTPIPRARRHRRNR
jgi:hypothetical protein